MSRKGLEREYGLLLGTCGPVMMERAFWFREMADMLEKDGSENAAQYLRTQAQRAEETVKTLGRAFENGKQ